MPSSLPRWPAGSDRSWVGLFQPLPCSAAATAFPMRVQGRRTSWTFRGLLDVYSRYGLPVRRTAKRYVCLEGSDGFVTSTAAPIATGRSDPVARRDSHPLKIPDFHGAHSLRPRFISLRSGRGNWCRFDFNGATIPTFFSLKTRRDSVTNKFNVNVPDKIERLSTFVERN